MDKKNILVDKEVTAYFERFSLNHILKRLNIIMENTTHFDEDELVMVSKSKKQDKPYSIKLFCIGMESKKQVKITLQHGAVIGDQTYKFTYPILEVNEQGSDKIFEYTIDIDTDDDLHIVINPYLSKDKNSEPRTGYHYYK